MSVEQYQREVNSLDKEIASLEKKKSDKDKEYANLQSKIISTQKSITKNTSASTLSSKMNQIAGWQNDSAKRSSESAEYGKKIAEKRSRRNDYYIRLQKAQQDEQKKRENENKKIQRAYESRIEQLQKQTIYKVEKAPLLTSAFDIDDKYDAFISHAFEDKSDFVDELVEEMCKLGLNVWYDTDKLKWGDSMREKIDRGLSKSRYGVVVLSPNYIAEQKYWTKAELNGLFQVETINGKTILPIWHNLTKKQVTEYSPIIADRKAMTTANMTAAEIAGELASLFNINESEDISKV